MNVRDEIGRAWRIAKAEWRNFRDNGDTLRLLRDNPSLTRPAYIEADFKTMFEERLFADFAALWL